MLNLHRLIVPFVEVNAIRYFKRITNEWNYPIKPDGKSRLNLRSLANNVNSITETIPIASGFKNI